MLESMIVFCIVLLIGSVFLIMNRYVKRNILFGVFVPDDVQEHQNIEDVRKRFTRKVIMMALLFSVVSFIVSLWLQDSSMISFVILIALNTLIILQTIFYKQANKELRKLKAIEKWLEGKTVVRAVNTKGLEESAIIPSIFYIVPFIILTIATVYVALNYSAIPDVFAIHWNLHGQPDGFATKNIFSVFSILFIGIGMTLMMLVINLGMKHFPVMLNPAVKEASENYANKTSMINSMMIFFVAVVMSIMFSYILIGPVLYPDGQMPNYDIPILLLFIILPVVICFVMQIREDKKYRAVAAQNEKVPYHNEENYKLGLIYYNKDDDNLWVPKVSQFGMTLNMAKKGAWMILIGFLLLTLIPVLLVVFLG